MSRPPRPSRPQPPSARPARALPLVFTRLVARLAPLLAGGPLLGGCGTKALDVEALTLGCEDIDLNDPPASSVGSEERADQVDVFRDAVFLASDLQFDPQFVQGPDRVEIYERWVGDADGVETCLRPTVRFTDPPAGLAVLWFLEGESVAFGNVVIDN